MRANLAIVIGSALCLSACTGEGDGGGTGTATASTTDPTTTDATDSNTTDPTAGTTTTTDTDSGGTSSGTTAGTSGGSTGTPFLVEPDGGAGSVECDVWEQDCPDGEKCMPWANDGGNSWNATKCSPVDLNPGQVGDECSPEGSGVSGVDNCDVASMCYYIDPETMLGICVGFCEGSEANPMCDPGFVCTIVNDGVLILCRPECDPILQDCEGTAACLPASGSDQFTCIIDASGDGGAVGDPCEYINSCDPGHVCLAADSVPGCAGASGCCTEFCDLTAQDPNAMCSLAGQGAECVPWYEAGMEPPGLEHVGACAIPA